MAPDQKNAVENPASKTTSNGEKAADKSNTREASPSITSGMSEHPAISPKTTPTNLQIQTSSAQKENRRSDGAFGKYTFGPETAGWAMGMGMDKGSKNAHAPRERGGTVMPEPETEERMEELTRKELEAGKA